MRPRKATRPAAAGALCFAFSCAGADDAPAQTETTTPTARAAQTPQIAVHQRRVHVRAGRRAAVAGRLAPAVPGQAVALQLKRGRSWSTINRDRADAAGRYELRRRFRRTGSAPVRVRVDGAPGVLSGERRIGRLNVYRLARASWYGPGLYGNRTGCGGTLAAGRLGVAHRSLPCGTMVTFRHGGRSVRVPVIDRGPYVGGREYDLTAATARRLGFHGHGAILTTR
ncbi:MAG TPA: septal ring lytic transglycosylase RlpA family protein [Solirubrobacteraceae bacterium]|nr:septal ring lytic transglycosylase RlpA family protein [Solirubrobacteraceae bacterium]